MKTLLAVLVLVLVALAFGAGYWPQRERLAAAQADATQARLQLGEVSARLAQAEASARLGRLLGQLLALRDAVESRDLAQAQILSSRFFDQVREEWGKSGDAAVRNALDAVLTRRDAVTAALARGEAGVREAISLIERELRRAMGLAVPAAPAKAEPAAPAP